MANHGGCFYCKTTKEEILTSGIPKVPVLDDKGRPTGAPCVAVCAACLDKVETIRK